MRIIKFRGKTKYGKWAYGYLTERANGLCIDRNYAKDERNNEDPNFDVYACPYVIPETMGQFTGLRDKDGREIYEGDIVRWLFMRVCEMKGGVVFDSIMGCFVVYETDSSNKTQRRWINDLNGIKVIGNIHDNPELLKGGEQ